MCLLVLSLCLWGCGEKPGDSPDSSDPQTTADSEGRVSVTDRIRESVQAERESARAARESAEAEQESAEAAKESSAAVRESSAAVCESSAAGESSAAARESSAASQESLAEPIVLTASPDVDDIAGLGELRAGVEEPYYTDWAAFEVDMENGHNPYDVEWDYGELYDVYIEKSVWYLTRISMRRRSRPLRFCTIMTKNFCWSISRPWVSAAILNSGGCPAHLYFHP